MERLRWEPRSSRSRSWPWPPGLAELLGSGKTSFGPSSSQSPQQRLWYHFSRKIPILWKEKVPEVDDLKRNRFHSRKAPINSFLHYIDTSSLFFLLFSIAIDRARALMLPEPNPLDPCLWMTSRKNVSSWKRGLANIWSKQFHMKEFFKN